MNRRLRALNGAFLCLSVSACVGAGRPAGVPAQAVEIAIGKNPGWVYCWLDTSQNVNRCHVYNRKGERLSPSGDPADVDDVFVPFDGDGPVPSQRLIVDPQHTGWQYIVLTDGTFLIRPKDRDLLGPLISRLLLQREQSGMR